MQILAKKNMTLDMLAEKYGVTTRTIRNDINIINELLYKYELNTLELKNGGIIVVATDFAKILKCIDKDFYVYRLSKTERVLMAIALIVDIREYITLATVAEILCVSRATIINDLIDIKKVAISYGITINSYRHKGLIADGTEFDKRWFLVKVNSSYSFMNSFISSDVIKKMIAEILYEIEHTHKKFLMERAQSSIYQYLCVMLKRNLRGYYIEEKVEAVQEYIVLAEDIIRGILQYNEVEYKIGEVYYLSVLLSKCRYMENQTFNVDSVKIQIIARKFISKISEVLDINLNNDYNFFNNLSAHLEYMLMSELIPYADNTAIAEVIEENVAVLEAVKECLDVFENYSDRILLNTEIDYITIHVCTAIEQNNNKMEKLEKEINLNEVLVIISTIIERYSVSKAEIVMPEIEKELTQYFGKTSPRLQELLSADHIRVDIVCRDWKDAIWKSAEILLNKKYIDEKYIYAMINNIEKNGPYIVIAPGFALPHESIDKGTFKVGMSLIRLAEGVNFGAEELDPVKFVCCLSAIDSITHLKAFFNLINLLTLKEFRDDLSIAGSATEIFDIIKRYENNIKY